MIVHMHITRTFAFLTDPSFFCFFLFACAIGITIIGYGEVKYNLAGGWTDCLRATY
jgi:hypothetical protein